MTDTAIYDTLTTTKENRPMSKADATPAIAPAAPASAVSPIDDAFRYLEDRNDRLEYALGNLNGLVMRAGATLGPILTGGTYPDPDEQPLASVSETTPEDRRSTIARRVTGSADKVDTLTDALNVIARRLEAIINNVEL